MNDNNLICFLTCVRTKSISEAASSLGITHQAASKTIQKMEDELGYKLFSRGSRSGQNLRLSAAGKYLYERILESDRRLEWAYEDFVDEGISGCPQLKISFPDWLGIPKLAHETAVKMQSEGVDIIWQTGSIDFAVKQLLNRKTDVAIVPAASLSKKPQQPDCFCTAMRDVVRLRLVCQRSLLHSSGVCDMKQLLAQELYVGDSGTEVNEIIGTYYRNVCSRYGETSKEIHLLPNFRSAISEAVFGNGFTVISDCATPTGSPIQQLGFVPAEMLPEFPVPMACMYRLDRSQESTLRYVWRACGL